MDVAAIGLKIRFSPSIIPPLICPISVDRCRKVVMLVVGVIMGELSSVGLGYAVNEHN